MKAAKCWPGNQLRTGGNGCTLLSFIDMPPSWTEGIRCPCCGFLCIGIGICIGFLACWNPPHCVDSFESLTADAARKDCILFSIWTRTCVIFHRRETAWTVER